MTLAHMQAEADTTGAGFEEEPRTGPLETRNVIDATLVDNLDENPPHDLAPELTGRGHDVHTVHDDPFAGNPDPVVVRASRRRTMIVLRSTSQDPMTAIGLVDRPAPRVMRRRRATSGG